MWICYTKQRKDFNVVMDILEGQFKEKVAIISQKFSAGYYIVEFNPIENLTEDDRSVLRFMGCEEEVERELTLDEQMLEASVNKHMAYSRLRSAQTKYEETLKAYKELEKRYFAQSNKES